MASHLGVQKTGGKLVTDLKKKRDRKREKQSGVDSDSWMGPWYISSSLRRGFEGEQITVPERTAEQEAYTPDPSLTIEKELLKEPEAIVESSVFHGTEERDYLGRTYMHPPTDLEINLGGDGNCF
jgi:pre-mRNA-processing factor 17